MDAAERALLELCGGSETRYRVLRALFTNPETQFHLRGLAGAAGVDPSNALRLLQRLVDAGLCEQTNAKYRASADHPLRENLTALFRIAAARAAGGSQAKLDEIKRMTGQRLLEQRSLPEIRRKSIENLKRWRAKGVWSRAYDEWLGILRHGNDAMLRHVMVSADEDSNRLRQSLPYVGLLPRAEVKALNEEIAA